ncbi:hypothetical protein NE235_10590 [Actinoallomurus spadix]|nr:hypothetical protein [Actinoallomurus spadix]MCO5986549.1 hypothetical protein [Actinoallomurus spadix]
MLNTTASWLKEMARRREIPHTLIGGRYGFTDEHIAEIVQMFERRPEDATSTAGPRRRTTVPPQAVAPHVSPTQLRARRPPRKRTGAA